MADTFRPQLAEALRQRDQWHANLAQIFEQVELLALPTVPIFPPSLDELQGDPTPSDRAQQTQLVVQRGRNAVSGSADPGRGQSPPRKPAVSRAMEQREPPARHRRAN